MAPRRIDLEALDLAEFVRPCDRIVWGQALAEPTPLLRALRDAADRIGGFEAFLGIGTAEPVGLDQIPDAHLCAYCATGSNRALAASGRLDILPVPYSQFPDALRGTDVVMLQVPPPRDGLYSMGLAVDYLAALLGDARRIIVEENARLPWIHGTRTLRAEEIDLVVPTDRDPAFLPPVAPGPAERAIARRIAERVENGATMQLGLGAVPEAVLGALSGHSDLGVHTGALMDGIVELIEAGVVTNARKPIDPGVTVAGFLLGGPKTLDFAADEPRLRLAPTSYTHGADVLANLPKFTAVNSAIEVDLTGQVNAEVAGGRYVGAVGGAGDFLRAAHRSEGGLPIVALPSTAAKGRVSRIVAELSGPVSTARSEAGLIVTEHGVADLRGRTLSERRRLMLEIADPAFREALARAQNS